MMAMKFYRPSIRFSRELEFDVWRESNLIESYGTSKEGLALAATKRGFSVYTMGVSRHHSFVDALASKIPNLDYEILELFYKDTRLKFRTMGLKNVSRKIELAMMKRILRKSQVPVMLTNTRVFGER
jgi:hypothetical protein